MKTLIIIVLLVGVGTLFYFDLSSGCNQASEGKEILVSYTHNDYKSVYVHVEDGICYTYYSKMSILLLCLSCIITGMLTYKLFSPRLVR